MARKPFRIPLMLIISFAVCVLVLFNGIANYLQARSSLKHSVDEIITRTGENTAASVSAWFGSKSLIVSGAAQSVGASVPRQDVIKMGQLAGGFVSMYIGTDKGEMISPQSATLSDDYDPRTRPWFTMAQQANKQIVTPPYNDTTIDTMVITFAQPVGQDVIAADVALKDVINEVLAVKVGNTGYGVLIDADNKYLVHRDSNKVGLSVETGREKKRLSNAPTEIEINGEIWFAAVFAIDGVDWKFMLLQKEDDAMSGLASMALSNFVISGVTILTIILLSVFVRSSLLKPLFSLNKAMFAMTTGDADLTRRLSATQQNEVGRLSQSFNQFISIIQNLVKDTLHAARHLNALSEQARESARTNNHSIKIQQTEIAQVATAVNEMSTTASNMAENASDTAKAAKQAAEEGNIGMSNAKENKVRMEDLTQHIEETTHTINRLDEQTQQINVILATIQGIAEQTNLLALNAAIEAARAGENGRGFAVVADEVRALSARTHEATGEIQNVIKDLQTQTQSAVGIMSTSKELTSMAGEGAEQVTKSLINISEAIADISRRANTIANSADEQHTSTEELNRIATAIKDATDQLADNVQKSTGQSDELFAVGQEIDQHLSRFRV